METVGFIGLGAMGAPMAWNLDDAGFDLQVYNRSDERTEPFGDAGVTVADTPGDAATGADAVVIMVTDGSAVLDVLHASDGVLAQLEDDAVVVQQSTISRETTKVAAEAVEEAGGRYVDAPVAGTLPSAESGTLTVLASGSEADLAAVRPLLEAMGDPVLECGSRGQGTNTKLAMNSLLGVVMEGLAESMVFAQANDVDPDLLLEAIDSGGLAAPFFQAKGEKIADRDFSSQFALDLLSKDLSLALEAAEGVPTPMPATAASRESVVAARGHGHGEEDMAAVVRFLEAASGFEVGTGEDGDEGEE